MNCNVTMKVFASAVAAAASAVFPLVADVTLAENMALDADADWRDRGTVTIAEGVTLDLNGHTLRVAAIAGAGRVTDSKSYELLDFIEANGAQRIVTDLVPNANTAVEVVATPTDNSALTLFGTKSWSNYRFLCMCQNNNWYFFGKTIVVGTFTTNTRYRFVVAGGKSVLMNDATDTLVGSKDVQMNNDDNAALAICGITGSTQRGKFKMHSFKVWQDKSMRFDFVPARNPATGDIGLVNRLDGTMHVSDESPFAAGIATGSIGIGALRVEAASEAALAGFTGTVDANVRFALDGSCTLASNADWRRFGTLAIDGTVDLAGRDLSLSRLYGIGTATDSTDEYDRLEYVEATGTQMVKTGIVPSTDTAVEIDFTLPAAGEQDRTIFGCKSWTSKRYLMIFANNQIYFFGAGTIFCAQAAGMRYRITVTPGTSPNGTVAAVNAATGASLGSQAVDLTNSDNTELALFDLADDANHERGGRYRLHSFKITKGGGLKRDLVPVRHAKTGKVGLLDRVSGDLFTSSTGTELVAGPVVTEAGNPGRLHVDVAEGQKALAESVALSGTLALVKEGAGTLTVNRMGQTYTGGTRIAGGILDTMNSGPGSIYVYIASRGYLGKIGTDISIDSGAVFDFKGNADYRLYNTIMNGGTLRNSGYDMADNTGSFGTVRLTADSRMETACNTTFFDVAPLLLDLGGNTLTVETMGKRLYFHNAGSVTNGVLWLKGNGSWRVNAAVNARGATLRTESALWIGAQLDVDDYYAACTFDSNNGTAAMNVHGRFTPATDYFYGCTMQHGSVLDLNGRSGAWSTTSAFTAGSNRVTFAPGATVTVDVHARRSWSGKVVDWGEGNAPEGVVFRLDDESRAAGRALVVRSDGLYVTRCVMMIIR
ncbi:MAG: autotransporter-associated beta strand repeat-containing protein [Kiritimatiellae bacterium]|nr:autotransporter-associated beta strand repeat-containing protein [Kiritimatiellia bacterium]